MILVEKAPPFATVQDRGWRTGRAIGLPRGGAMDLLLLEQANALVGNAPGAAGIEWALGPGTLVTDAACEMTVLGAGSIEVDGLAADPEHPVLRLRAGARVTIAPDPEHRLLYVAVRGGIDVPMLMGSRSTYLPGGFGGLEGRRLRNGDRLPVGLAQHSDMGGVVHPRRRPETGSGSDVLVTVTRGPQWELFGPESRSTLLEARYIVATSDRMGYRLKGPSVTPRGSSTLPSEAACPGAVQIPDDGQPIVIMPDGPTVGGYPKIVVVTEGSLGRVAQCSPGRGIRLKLAGP